MTSTFIDRFGHTTLAEVWADGTLHGCLARFGYTIIWSEEVFLYSGQPSVTEDFVLVDAVNGTWFATRVGMDLDADVDLWWGRPEHRVSMLHTAFEHGYGGPTDSLLELVHQVAAGAAPQPDVSNGNAWGAGHILNTVLPMLDETDRASTEMLFGLTYPHLLPALRALRDMTGTGN